MNNTSFSTDRIRDLFESVLPDNLSVKEFREDLNQSLLALSPRDFRGEKIPPRTPKEAFDRACMDAKLKQILNEVYGHKFEVEFYDLICLSILILNEENQMLSQFLCTEILQTTFDSTCQQVCIYRIQRMVTEKAENEDAENNGGIHSSLYEKIENAEHLKDFLSVSQAKYSEFEVDSVEFGEDLIKISITSIAEYIYGDDMQFGTSYPVATIKIELSSIFNIYSDTSRWNELGMGRLYILPSKSTSNEDIMELSFIHEPSSSPYFKFKCKSIKVTDFSLSGINY